MPAQPVLPRRRRRLSGPGGRRLAVTALLVGLAVGGGVPLATGATAAPTDSWSSSEGGPGTARTNPGESRISARTAARIVPRWSVAERSASSAAPAVVGTTVYSVDSAGNGNETGTFVATSSTTGAVLWTVPLPSYASASVDLAVSGGYALLPYLGMQRPGGLLAIDLTTRRLAWSASLPPASFAFIGNDRAQGVVADGTRAYVTGAGNAVNTYRLTDGALLWTAALSTADSATGAPRGVEGLAVDGTVVFSGGGEGLTARDSATGRLLWTGPGETYPVVAGGRVFSSSRDQVVAVDAAGCGRSTCPAVWTRSIADVTDREITLGAADASSLFVSYSTDVPSPTDSRHTVQVGKVARLDAATGAVQRTISRGGYMGPVIRGGDVIYVQNSYYGPRGHAQRVLAYPALGMRTKPLRTIDVGTDLVGNDVSLAIGGGTLVLRSRIQASLTGYRLW